MPGSADACLVSEARECGLLERMPVVAFGADDVIFREGDHGATFLLVGSGSVAITRRRADVGRVGPGSVLGELALLTGQRRSTTVRALSDVRGWWGTAQDFDAMLQIDSIRTLLHRVAIDRLAVNIDPIAFTTAKGFTGYLRPLLPSDRDEYVKNVRSFSSQAKRLRFFTGGEPSPALIDYLLAVDYLNHFAWIILDAREASGGTGPGGALPGVAMPGVAIARFIRSNDDPTSADTAFAVSEQCHGLGLATVLLGALAIAAEFSGISTFTADVLMENAAMRKVLAHGGATWLRSEPGIVGARLAVEDAGGVLTPTLAADIRRGVEAFGLANETLLGAS